MSTPNSSETVLCTYCGMHILKKNVPRHEQSKGHEKMMKKMEDAKIRADSNIIKMVEEKVDEKIKDVEEKVDEKMKDINKRLRKLEK